MGSVSVRLQGFLLQICIQIFQRFFHFTIAQDIEIILEDSTDDRSLEKWFQDDGSAFPSENPPNFNFDDVVLLPYSSGK